MSIFKKKTRKVPVKSEDTQEHKIHINIQPLVQIEQVKVAVNGIPKTPTYRLLIGGKDVITLTSREYWELFTEMLRKTEDSHLIHLIAEVHNESHEENSFGGSLVEMLETLEKSGLGQILEKELGKNEKN